MGQRNDLAEKKKVSWDGEEVPGLVSVGIVGLEDGSIDVPEFNYIRKIRNGQRTIPEVAMVYKLQKDSKVLTFFQNFYLKKETHSAVIIRTDATGTEFARTLLTDCECIKYEEPEYDAASPTFAKVSLTVVPFDVVPLPPQ